MKASEIKIGETYNHIKVLKDLGCVNNSHLFLCECLVCGKNYALKSDRIGVTKSCKSCMHKVRAEEFVGTRCGRLTVKELAYKNDSKHCLMWLCECDCGRTTILPTTSLIGKRSTRSCGCLKKDIIRERGREYNRIATKSVSRDFEYEGMLREHPNYVCWQSMLRRCDTPNAKNYHRYGGRGIKVCDRWLKENNGFENFVNDMGIRPSKQHTLDRIDVNGDYCPENCRWATWKEQENNRRNNNKVVFDGGFITVTQLAEMLGLDRNRIYTLLKQGVDIDYIIQNRCNYLNKIKVYYDGHINFNKTVNMDLFNKITSNGD